MFTKRFVAAAISFVLLTPTAWAKAETTYVSFHNIELSTLQRAKLVGPIDPQQLITFTIWLKLKNKEQLDHFVNELYNPHSFHYQKFLTKKDFAENYAPSENTIKTVENYFMSHDMKTKRVYNTIQVTAEAYKIEKLLQIKLNRYLHNNKIVYGNASEPKLNTVIAQSVFGISDLSNISYGHPNIHKTLKLPNAAKPQSKILKFVWDSFFPQATPTTTSLQGLTGANVRAAYNVANTTVNGTTIDGTGQTLTIIDGCGTSTPDDIMNAANHFNEASSLPLLSASNFAVVDYNGNPYVKGSITCDNASDWDGEIALDVEATHTMAPGANIVLIMTNGVANTQVATAINTILDNAFTIGGFSNAYVVSNSWDNDHDNQNETLEPTLETGSAMGLSINFAAGDCGDQTYTSSWPCPKLGNSPSIQYPVSSAYVTAVGGTSLFVDNNYNYAFESGWGTYVNGALYSGSMGGISKWRSFPTWQAPISTFTAGGYGVVGNTNRAIPDIAMVADYYTGLMIYQGGSFYQTGGASQSTPLFSGVVTLVNQARALLNGGTANPIGLVAPYLYTNNRQLINSRALNLVSPPHLIISGATPVNGGPVGAFNLQVDADTVTFNWDGELSIVEDQFWNDVVGVGSPNVPNFVATMGRL